MRKAVIWAILIVMGGVAVMGADDENTRVLFAFDDPAQAGTWRLVNDGVMGGVSEGRLRLTDDGTLEFSGILSLENNGGFASIRSAPGDLGLRPGDAIQTRVRGDGRSYILNLYVPNSRMAFSYRAAIPTTRDEWTTVWIPVDDFRAHWFGRPVDDALDVERVHSLGFMLSDGKPGPFRIEIDSIQITSAGSKT